MAADGVGDGPSDRQRGDGCEHPSYALRATAIGTEIADTAVEEGISWAAGVPIVVPVSVADIFQDGGKLLFKQGAKDALEVPPAAALPKGGVKVHAEAPDTVAERLRIQNKAQQARDTAPTRGLGGRSLTPAQRSELNTFAEKARAKGYTENPNRTGSFGEIVDGKFKERVRIDIGDPSQPSWRGKTHLNFPEDRGHYPPDTPL